MDREDIERCKSLILEGAEDIVHDRCGLDDDELFDVAMTLVHRKMYIGQIENAYHISARTIERYIEQGYLPPYQSEPSGKKYIYQDDIERFLINKKETIREVKQQKKKSIIDKLLRRN